MGYSRAAARRVERQELGLGRGATQSFGGGFARRAHARPSVGGGGASLRPVWTGIRSIHGSMMASLLRAPPRRGVRTYVLNELRHAGRRMDCDELVEIVSCPGYDYDGNACAKHGKNRCGAIEIVKDVDGKGNIVRRQERKLGAATPYEVSVAIGSLLAADRIEIVDGQLRLPRKWKAPDRVSAAERWRRDDEEIRLRCQRIDVHETRSVYEGGGDWGVATGAYQATDAELEMLATDSQKTKKAKR